MNGTREKEALVTDNLGLVHACANRFKGRGVEYEDLYQAGCVGLVKAAAGFDETSVVLSSQDLCDPLCQRFAPFGKRKQRRFLHFVASRNSVVKPGS